MPNWEFVATEARGVVVDNTYRGVLTIDTRDEEAAEDRVYEYLWEEYAVRRAAIERLELYLLHDDEY